MPVKHKLRAERTECGYTQKALGAAAGVSPSTISHIECHRGPDVPRSQLHPTKTKTDTAVRLVVALEKIPPGEYTEEEFARIQKFFTRAELFEAPVNQRKRALARQRRTTRHLRAVS